MKWLGMRGRRRKIRDLPDLVAKGRSEQRHRSLLPDAGRWRTWIERNIGASSRRTSQRLFSLQRPDGQWSYKFEPDQPEVEFQTGHVLWTLHEAGVPRFRSACGEGGCGTGVWDRQQDFGGWLDPLQSFENFRTPFRETQFAVMGLAAYYPLGERAKGWNSPVIDKLSHDPVRLLEQLDEVWDRRWRASFEGDYSGGDGIE